MQQMMQKCHALQRAWICKIYRNANAHDILRAMQERLQRTKTGETEITIHVHPDIFESLDQHMNTMPFYNLEKHV